MNPEETPFEQFFAERIKAKGLSLKKLSDITGITPSHLESMLRGDYANIPSAPYFRGYLLRLGKVLDFDGEAWWNRLKGDVKNSGGLDSLPKNRFIKSAPPKYLWAVVVGAIVLMYVIFQFTRIIGKPALALTYPSQNPYTTNVNTITITGTTHDADSLYINDTQQVTLAPDGSWRESVFLGNGLNPFKFTAKKFLGGSTDITEQIWYQAPGTPASASSTPAVHSETSTPAT